MRIRGICFSRPNRNSLRRFSQASSLEQTNVDFLSRFMK
ncbi:hypothetical protein LEP1GSC061_0818 [Leptospira wolffii serovar Khorat str. Khorat-H2]|nr:hypothetical protein LEP1GSC061_0818 [Leptospira wolffii serovar Khorat str. Khorat-H2]